MLASTLFDVVAGGRAHENFKFPDELGNFLRSFGNGVEWVRVKIGFFWQ
jgi:hypothetical protein